MEAYSQVDPNDRPKKMRKLIHGLPREQKPDAEELGCVLADMTDSYSSKEEEHSQSQDSPAQSPQNNDDTDTFDFTQEQLIHMADSELIGTNADLENWSGVLQDFLMKDNTV